MSRNKPLLFFIMIAHMHSKSTFSREPLAKKSVHLFKNKQTWCWHLCESLNSITSDSSMACYYLLHMYEPAYIFEPNMKHLTTSKSYDTRTETQHRKSSSRWTPSYLSLFAVSFCSASNLSSRLMSGELMLHLFTCSRETWAEVMVCSSWAEVLVYSCIMITNERPSVCCRNSTTHTPHRNCWPYPPSSPAAVSWFWAPVNTHTHVYPVGTRTKKGVH